MWRECWALQCGRRGEASAESGKKQCGEARSGERSAGLGLVEVRIGFGGHGLVLPVGTRRHQRSFPVVHVS